jgi:rhodanese-related sulfurtransferase
MLRRTLALAIALFLFGSPVSAETEFTRDSLDKVKQQLAEKKAVLVDVREPSEWNRGHVADAVLVPLGELAKKAKEPDFAAQLEKSVPKDKIVYCHCAKGGRAVLAADVFQKLGYDVRPLKPGYQDLLGAGFPKADDPKK